MTENCPVCTQNAASVVFNSPDFDLVSCDTCHLVRKEFSSKVNTGDIQRLQDSVYTSLHRTEMDINQKMSLDRIEVLRKTVTGGRLLEVGCATGEFLDTASQYGFDAVGVDASRRHAEYAVKQGLNVMYGRLEDAGFEPSSFDAIVMFHLFEHLEDPNGFLQDVRELLSEQGQIMIVVPNGKSFTNTLFGYNHPVYQQADHLYFYDQETLTQILSQNGFEVLSVQAKEYRHHLFTSALCYMNNKRKASKEGPQAEGSEMSVESETTNSPSGTKEKVKSFLRDSPYLLSKILFPLLWPYSKLLENSCRGHELIIVAQRK